MARHASEIRGIDEELSAKVAERHQLEGREFDILVAIDACTERIEVLLKRRTEAIQD